MLQKIRYFLFLLAVLVVIVVAFQNDDEVDINVLTFKGRYPLTLLLLGTSVVSFVLGSMVTAWRFRKRDRSKTKTKPESKSKPKTSANTNSALNSALKSKDESSPLTGP